MRVINFLEAMDGDQDLKDEESCEKGQSKLKGKVKK